VLTLSTPPVVAPPSQSPDTAGGSFFCGNPQRLPGGTWCAKADGSCGGAIRMQMRPVGNVACSLGTTSKRAHLSL
jgi:hypothetical protein